MVMQLIIFKHLQDRCGRIAASAADHADPGSAGAVVAPLESLSTPVPLFRPNATTAASRRSLTRLNAASPLGRIEGGRALDSMVWMTHSKLLVSGELVIHTVDAPV
jgi:hypothetical protein